MIDLQHVTKKFGSRLAVTDLCLSVTAGEIYGLLGHNGAGKSTAIGMMLGQVWPTSGTVMVGGFDVFAQRQHALHKVGAIFEAPVFYDYLSGWRNLEILSSYTAPTSRRRLQEVVSWVGLTGREHSRVKTYSHGMRARLALAQALLPNPNLLILDEPSNGLDPEGIHEMRQTILRLRHEFGLTILLSSHLLNEVEQLCSRIAVMNGGKKIFEGSLAEAKGERHWIRLRVDNFPRALAEMQNAQMLAETRDGLFVALRTGIGTDQVVRHLVQKGVAIYEIAPEKQTLEDFYLSLMEERGEVVPS